MIFINPSPYLLFSLSCFLNIIRNISLNIHMKKIILVFCIFFPLSTFGNTFTKVEIHNHITQYITYNNLSENYDIKIWVSETWSNLKDLMSSHGWVSAINGIFFCPADYNQCNGENFTINERFVEWREISTYKSTWERVIFWWDESKQPLLHQTDKINSDERLSIYEGVANFPLLLHNWKNTLEHYYDIGLIGKKMRTPLTRHFICSDESWENITFGQVEKASLDQVVPILLEIWCYNALNLDAGRSSAFIYNGKYLTWPWRDILDGIIIQRTDLNTSQIDTILQTSFEKIEKQYTSKRNKNKAKETLQNYRNQLIKIRALFYKKYTTTVEDIDKNPIWYSIALPSASAHKKIYIINQIDFYIAKIIRKL